RAVVTLPLDRVAPYNQQARVQSSWPSRYFPVRVVRQHFLVFALVALPWLAPLTATSARPGSDVLSDTICIIGSTTPLQGALAGMIVTKLETGDLAYCKTADELMNSTSNVKILISAAALALLGPNFRYTTEILFGGPLENGVLQG